MLASIIVGALVLALVVALAVNLALWPLSLYADYSQRKQDARWAARQAAKRGGR